VTVAVVLIPTIPLAVEISIVGQIMAGMFSSKTAFSKDQQKSYTHLYYEGVWICLKTSLFLHKIGYF